MILLLLFLIYWWVCATLTIFVLNKSWEEFESKLLREDEVFNALGQVPKGWIYLCAFIISPIIPFVVIYDLFVKENTK